MGKQISNEDREDRLSFTGSIVSSNTGIFQVELEPSGQTVVCTPAGKIRKNKIHLVVGDKVRVELSPYDMTKGRIMFRL